MAVLLLQGPLGSFSKYFAQALIEHGQEVYKINFNGGDEFYSAGCTQVAYTGTTEGWGRFITEFIVQYDIELVFAYGDCRYYHREAKRICLNHDVRYFAFEEGYLRPNYITVEEGGVNGHSPLAGEDGHKMVCDYEPMHTVQNEAVMPANFSKRFLYASFYYITAFINRFKFSSYKHHRSFNPVYEAFSWCRGFYRKGLYKLTEKTAKQLCGLGEFFLVPLQVHNDAQIEFHSRYDSMECFIKEVMVSFAQGQRHCNLLIKHHPMDRGHAHYGKLIQRLAKQLGLEGRVFYIHDQHLPTLLKACLGVVTINSTTALQGFYHKAPVKVMGDAFFDMPSLTHQGDLQNFWLAPQKPNEEFSDRFRGYLLDHGQVNGSFYCEWQLTVHNLMAYLVNHGVLAKPA